jgi:adenylate cyclase
MTTIATRTATLILGVTSGALAVTRRRSTFPLSGSDDGTTIKGRPFERSFVRSVGARLTHFPGAILIAGVLVAIWSACHSASIFPEGAAGTVLSTAIGTIVLVSVSMIKSEANRRRETLMRQRLEQHLAAPVVRRILHSPDELKLVGERREITALFTDLEGFTAMMRRTDPTTLLSILDSYFEGVATIVAAYGGMIDKIVGDAVHVFFNATTDLEDHPYEAIKCAIEVRAWTEEFRLSPNTAKISFGRTRIGIETGPAIVGDVGICAKLDYTAHGEAVVVASRLERANKELGSSICIGPVAATRCPQKLLRPLGTITLKGFEKVSPDGCSNATPVFEPWPCEAPTDWRRAYLAAIRLYDQDPEGAARWFDQLSAEQAVDEVTRRIAFEMLAGTWRRYSCSLASA